MPKEIPAAISLPHPPGAAVDRSHGFGPNDTQKILDFLHNSPTYGPIFNIPVFNPANFPAGVPDE